MTCRQILQVGLSSDGRKYEFYLKTGKKLSFSDYMEVEVKHLCEILVSSRTNCVINIEEVGNLFFGNKIYVSKIRKKKFLNVHNFPKELLNAISHRDSRRNKFTFEGFCKLKRIVIFEKIK